eukprot:s413_g6.t1
MVVRGPQDHGHFPQLSIPWISDLHRHVSAFESSLISSVPATPKCRRPPSENGARAAHSPCRPPPERGASPPQPRERRADEAVGARDSRLSYAPQAEGGGKEFTGCDCISMVHISVKQL